MPEFHCPLGAAFYDAEDCILCGLCEAVTKAEVQAATEKLRTYLQANKDRKTALRKIAICGKGGVGKSTITTLLANSLCQNNFTVFVIDNDESNTGLRRNFGFDREPRPLIKLLSRFASGQPEPATEWITQSKISTDDIPSDFIVSRSNLKFMLVGKITDPLQGCACTMADVTRDLLIKLSLRENEAVVIDMEAGVESFGRGVERAVDTVLVVIEPSRESMSLAEKIWYLAEGIGVRSVRAVLNKIPSPESQTKIENFLKERGIKIAGTIHFDEKISSAGFEGAPIEDSRAQQEMNEIVRKLLEDSKQFVPAQNPP